MRIRKWTIARRGVQAGVLALIASPLFGMAIFRGNLSAGTLFGINLADPPAFLQATLASRVFVPSFLGAAAVVAALYYVTGGRSFCGWVCPVYLVTELGEKLRSKLGTGQRVFSLSGTRWSLGITLALSLLVGVPFFEIVSPIGVLTRAVMFKAWQPLLLIAAIMAVELLFARRIWCRSLCPVGGFYAMLGRYSPTRVRFVRERCTNCGDCLVACPVEEVLAPSLVAAAVQVSSGDCTRCGACIDVCEARALHMQCGLPEQ